MECVSACPRNIVQEKASKVAVNQKNFLNCNLCKACSDACKPLAIMVDGDRNKVILKIESFGQLKPDEILGQATKVLAGKLSDFKASFK
jgi:Fe-S-cluster-containing hydrogenase component 2